MSSIFDDAVDKMMKYPWRTRAGLLALVDALAGVVLVLGFATNDINEVVSSIGAIIAVLVSFGIVKEGEQHTTPLAEPRDSEGRRLMPENQ